ncbi:hypothetical protein [Ramlibacter sp. AN1133]|uniref:hypothetical protein n=1 Tax=Ramlibacter sp. AN1133 TaxID=3133429 RepID=UPI0030BD48C3
MPEKKTVMDMSEPERDRTEMWFAEARSGIIADLIILDNELEDASVQQKADLNREKARVVRTQTMVERAEEAFFTDRTKALEPPSQTQINETKRLTADLGNEIAANKASQAAVRLVSDLATFIGRMLA